MVVKENEKERFAFFKDKKEEIIFRKILSETEKMYVVSKEQYIFSSNDETLNVNKYRVLLVVDSIWVASNIQVKLLFLKNTIDSIERMKNEFQEREISRILNENAKADVWIDYVDKLKSI